MEIFAPMPVKEKRPPGRQATHSVEYMMMVAKKVAEEGMTYREAGKTFNISHGTVNAWVQKYKNRTLNSKRRERKSKYDQEVEEYRHTAQIKELKHEIAELYLENRMLKKALKHSLQLKKESSSIVTSENLEQLKEDAE
jgi:transposase